MKRTIGIDIGTYTFNASMRTISISGINSLALNQFLLITNTTSNTIIYNFADPNAGGTLTQSGSNYILTLTYNTTSMSNNDSLQIFFEVEDNSEDSLLILRKILKVLESNAIVDPRRRQKMVIDAVGTDVVTTTETFPVLNPDTGEVMVNSNGIFPETYVVTSYTSSSTECEASLIIGGSASISNPTGTSLTSGGNGPTVNPPTLATTVYWPIWEGPEDQRWRIIDDSRSAFLNGIRKNLIFT